MLTAMASVLVTGFESALECTGQQVQQVVDVLCTFLET